MTPRISSKRKKHLLAWFPLTITLKESSSCLRLILASADASESVKREPNLHCTNSQPSPRLDCGSIEVVFNVRCKLPISVSSEASLQSGKGHLEELMLVGASWQPWREIQVHSPVLRIVKPAHLIRYFDSANVLHLLSIAGWPNSRWFRRAEEVWEFVLNIRIHLALITSITSIAVNDVIFLLLCRFPMTPRSAGRPLLLRPRQRPWKTRPKSKCHQFYLTR